MCALTIKNCTLTIVTITSALSPPIDMHVCMSTPESFRLCFWTCELKYKTDNRTPFVRPAEVSTSRPGESRIRKTLRDCSPWCKKVKHFYGTNLAKKNLSRLLQIAGKGMVFILFVYEFANKLKGQDAVPCQNAEKERWLALIGYLTDTECLSDRAWSKGRRVTFGLSTWELKNIQPRLGSKKCKENINCTGRKAMAS